MKQAADALGQGNRAGALASQNDALGSLQESQQNLAELRELLEELKKQMGQVDKTLARPDATQADALAAVEGALNSPAWQMGQQAPLSTGARAEMGQLRQALQSARTAMGGSSRPSGSSSGGGRRSAELEGIEPEGRISVDALAQFKLPEHLRQELLEGLREKGPEAYQKILEEYYRSIAKEE